MADLIDEFLSAREGFVKSGNVLVKANKAPPSWDADKRSARFIMSTEQEDRDRDIIVQAGGDLTEFLKNPAAPFAHRSYDFAVGSWANVEQLLTGRPKRLEGDLILLAEGEDEMADRVARHIAGGTLRACSIGFIPKSVERREVPEDKRDSYFWPGWMIHEWELVECSPCLIPANPGAMAKAALGGDTIAREILEDVLDNWAKHPETGLLIPREEFEAAFKSARAARSSVVISKDLLRRPATFAVGAELKAKSQDEARTFVGAEVVLDLTHEENKGAPFEDIGEARGEVIDSWIVEEGAKAGAHALAVEFVTPKWQGMFRGIAADRLKLVVAPTKALPEPAPPGLFDQVKAFIAKALGKTVEEIEAPEVEHEPENPAPADAAAKEAAVARAAAIEERLTAKLAA
ncbi:HK97 family phage prohead protease [Phenylobacterium sp. J426]|uniref:HK97 family phage prohead protease n=1 Tax=Phenylobacterium sp. J426 TaxID=2898439 RepID=UPI0021514384|nr:HK97 family phage prohead protease [Phenylobacterium sp. J426]MCR5875161.1 HK97 family phage prohead protease [Phenylobacterium sp. J426]